MMYALILILRVRYRLTRKGFSVTRNKQRVALQWER